jgi:hypothetical protein
MKIQILICNFLGCLILNDSYCQKEHKISFFIEGQYINTIYDQTLGNNPWGIALGIQTYLNNHTLLHPTIEISAATYLEDDKVLILNSNGSSIDRINSMISFFAGASIQPGQLINFSILTGPTFINSNIYLGVKPAIGFYFTKRQKAILRMAFINVFNRLKNPNSDFGSISVSLGVKLF